MNKNYLLKKLNFAVAFFVAIAVLALSGVSFVYAANHQKLSEFTQVVNPGVLGADIVDAAFATVAAPNVPLSAVTFGFTCQTSTGKFGTTTEKLYISNPTGATWGLNLAATTTTAVWRSTSTPSLSFDYNDAGGSPTGCIDNATTADADSVAGQMTVDPSVATVSVGQCTGGCVTGNVTLGTSAAFNEGSVDIISIATGAATIGDYTIEQVDISQTIPQEQGVASDYAIELEITAI